ncbi:PAS domain-containing protein [Ferrovibrio sp.]|uniref:PAS domain-containing protein n=1 Tax=Ferrovibrio sp. TaxID=1917215 RepID=UPI0026393E63|nr:PAS domain-containing protein [Ferrovibrio sp.]
MGQETPGAPRHITPVAEADLDPQLQWLLGYWAEKRGGRRFPARSDIDPLELKSLLGHILMVDVVRQGDDAPPRFRYRLFGTEFVFYHGADLTGHWLDEIANREFRDELLALYRAVAVAGVMRTLSYDYLVDRQRHRFQAVLLPLSSDGGQVDIVLGCGVRVGVI